MVPEAKAEAFWRALIDAGVAPCGLGARDTLRLEAGMNLYSPLVANMGWTIAWEPEARDFIGRAALTAEKQRGIKQKLVGLVLEGKGVLRADQEVWVDGVDVPGIVTSGTFSPTLGGSIALARIPMTDAQHCEVQVRQKRLPARIVGPNFVRHGKKVF